MQRHHVGKRHCEDDRIDHVVADFLEKEEAGQCPDPEVWLNRYPDLRPALSSILSEPSGVQASRRAVSGFFGHRTRRRFQHR